MCLYEHYYEVLDMLSNLFIYIFDNLSSRYGKEIEVMHAFRVVSFVSDFSDFGVVLFASFFCLLSHVCFLCFLLLCLGFSLTLPL
jgi:hypothetical protein